MLHCMDGHSPADERHLITRALQRIIIHVHITGSYIYINFKLKHDIIINESTPSRIEPIQSSNAAMDYYNVIYMTLV